MRGGPEGSFLNMAVVPARNTYQATITVQTAKALFFSFKDRTAHMIGFLAACYSPPVFRGKKNK